MVYVDYSKTFKNILSDRSHLLLTLKYTVALPGLVIFSNKAILWWLQVTSFNYQPGLHYSTERNGIFRGILWHYSPERNKLGLELGPLYWNVYSGSNIFAYHKVTKDNSFKVTLHTCANVQPGTVAIFKQFKLLDGLLNQLCIFHLKMYGELRRKNAPLFGLKALCLPKYQIPPLQAIYFWDQQSLLYLLSI